MTFRAMKKRGTYFCFDIFAPGIISDLYQRKTRTEIADSWRRFESREVILKKIKSSSEVTERKEGSGGLEVCQRMKIAYRSLLLLGRDIIFTFADHPCTPHKDAGE